MRIQNSPLPPLPRAPRASQPAAHAAVKTESASADNTINLSEKTIKGLLWGGAAATAVGLGWMGYNVSQQLLSLGSASALGTAAGCALGGFLLADLASGFVHHALDNYATKDTKMIGYIAQDFQAHHHDAGNILKSKKVGLLFPWAQVMPPALLAVGALNPHYAVTSALLAAAGGIAFAQLSHQLTHDPKPGLATKILRRFHVAQQSHDHLAHHRAPWASNYCFLNGAWNGVLDKTNFWRKWEKAVHKCTGVEPKVWKHPAVKAKALENISEAEYSQRLKSQLPEFKKNLDFDRERKESLEFMHPELSTQTLEEKHIS